MNHVPQYPCFKVAACGIQLVASGTLGSGPKNTKKREDRSGLPAYTLYIDECSSASCSMSYGHEDRHHAAFFLEDFPCQPSPEHGGMSALDPEGNGQYRFRIIYLFQQSVFKDFGAHSHRQAVFPCFPDALSYEADGGMEQFGQFMLRHTYLIARHTDGTALKIKTIPVFHLFLLPLECTCREAFVQAGELG